MSDKLAEIEALLARARAINDKRLSVRISALEAVKDKSTADCEQYKSLLKAMTVIESEGGGGTENSAESEIKSDGIEHSVSSDTSSDGSGSGGGEVIPSKYYMFIRMFGYMYRSDFDGYKKSFSSAEDCASFFYNRDEGKEDNAEKI